MAMLQRKSITAHALVPPALLTLPREPFQSEPSPGPTKPQALALRPGRSTFRLLHISDTHYHPHGAECEDVAPQLRRGCDHTNTTRFLQAAIAREDPDLVVFTGDVIDSGSSPSTLAMRELYGAARGRPFAATLGNHDDNLLPREQVMRFVSALNGSLAREGGVIGSPGNYHLDVLPSGAAAAGEAPLARLWFFDSRLGDVAHSINDAQLSWFERTSAALPSTRALMFYHIPLKEYQHAVAAGVPISGAIREPISADLPNKATFGALRGGGDDWIAGFCGHDHTNDFCALWGGVQLCYEGSPGFTAYGATDGSYTRRVRVSELRACAPPEEHELCELRSWKRLAEPEDAVGEAVDVELLWSRSGERNGERNAQRAAPRAPVAPGDGGWAGAIRDLGIPELRIPADLGIPELGRQIRDLDLGSVGSSVVGSSAQAWCDGHGGCAAELSAAAAFGVMCLCLVMARCRKRGCKGRAALSSRGGASGARPSRYAEGVAMPQETPHPPEASHQSESAGAAQDSKGSAGKGWQQLMRDGGLM